MSPEKYAIYEDAAAINHVTSDDPPVLLTFGTAMDTPITSYGIGIHHPRFGKALKERMDAAKVPCTLKAKGDAGLTPIEFIKQQFGLK